MRERQPHHEAERERRLIVDEQYAYRGTWDLDPEGVCGLRILDDGQRPPVICFTELPENESTSVTNMIELLTAEVLTRYLPHRVEQVDEEVAIVLEHYPDAPGRHLRQQSDASTYDRVTFASWTPRWIWLGGQQRLSLDEPDWSPLTHEEVRDLLPGIPEDGGRSG